MPDEHKPVLALLPHLTAEELEELHQAIQTRITNRASLAAMSTSLRDGATRSIQILHSLDTAVMEARYSLGE